MKRWLSFLLISCSAVYFCRGLIIDTIEKGLMAVVEWVFTTGITALMSVVERLS